MKHLLRVGFTEKPFVFSWMEGFRPLRPAFVEYTEDGKVNAYPVTSCEVDPWVHDNPFLAWDIETKAPDGSTATGLLFTPWPIDAFPAQPWQNLGITVIVDDVTLA